jgi:hypothetical protein
MYSGPNGGEPDAATEADAHLLGKPVEDTGPVIPQAKGPTMSRDALLMSRSEAIAEGRTALGDAQR